MINIRDEGLEREQMGKKPSIDNSFKVSAITHQDG